MAKKGSRRTGSAGIDLSSADGFLKYVNGSDPVLIDFASQAEAEAGTAEDKLMNPLRVKQAILDTLSGGLVSTKLNQSSAPTTSDNASQTDDQGNNFRAGSLWQHVISTPSSESDVDWYRLEGFNGSDAIWAPAEQLDATIVTQIQNDINTLQSDLDTAENDIDTLETNVTNLQNAIVIASQAEAEAGTDTSKLMTPERVAQAIAFQVSLASVSLKTAQSSAPSTGDNASQTDDQGNNLRVGSLWQHVKTSPIGGEADVDWYRLEGFNGSDAHWGLAEQVDAAVITALQDDINTLETDLTTAQGDISTLQSDLTTAQGTITSLNSSVLGMLANQFDSMGIVTLGSGETLIELETVPNAQSLRVSSQDSAGGGLWPLIEGEDFTQFGSWLFMRDGAGDGDATVDTGDKLDVDWFTNLLRPNAISNFAQSGSNLVWDAVGSDKVQIYKCAAANDPSILSNWTEEVTDVNETAETHSVTASTGDRFIARLFKTADQEAATCGVWSDIVTIA